MEIDRKTAPSQKYTETGLCATVFYLSRYAECLEIDKAITVPDERELFWMIYEWAKRFEENFDPGGHADHQAELETQGYSWLMETFPYMPELDEALQVTPQRQEILDFVLFEDSTSIIWPWAVSAEEIRGDEQKLTAVESMLFYDPQTGYDTDQLYDALDTVFGANPVLTQQHSGGVMEQTL